MFTIGNILLLIKMTANHLDPIITILIVGRKRAI